MRARVNYSGTLERSCGGSVRNLSQGFWFSTTKKRLNVTRPCSSRERERERGGGSGYETKATAVSYPRDRGGCARVIISCVFELHTRPRNPVNPLTLSQHESPPPCLCVRHTRMINCFRLAFHKGNRKLLINTTQFSFNSFSCINCCLL